MGDRPRGRQLAKRSYAEERAGKYTVKPSAELFRYWCYRWGYVPIKYELGAVLCLNPSEVSKKIHHRGFRDAEKIVLAREFELTTQEFCDLFFPGVFREDGTVILERDKKSKGIKTAKISDVYPMQNLK